MVGVVDVKQHTCYFYINADGNLVVPAEDTTLLMEKITKDQDILMPPNVEIEELRTLIKFIVYLVVLGTFPNFAAGRVCVAVSD